jgi:hypothetical protein
MSGMYLANQATQPTRPGQTFEIKFTGPGYCTRYTGNPNFSSSLDGTCTLKNGGMEFSSMGSVEYYTIDNGALVRDGIRLTHTP